MTDMKQALENAGVQTTQSRTYVACLERLQKYGKPTSAFADTMDWLCKECPLSVFLSTELDLRQQIGTAVFRYLQKCQDDMAGKPAGGVHGPLENQTQSAPATDKGGQSGSENQNALAARGGNGKGHRSRENQRPNARPGSRRTPKGHVAAIKSIFDAEIGVIGVRAGDITRHNLNTLDRQLNGVAHVVHRLLTEIDWPDDVTPLEKLATPGQLKTIIESGRAFKASFGTTKREARHVG